MLAVHGLLGIDIFPLFLFSTSKGQGVSWKLSFNINILATQIFISSAFSLINYFPHYFRVKNQS